MGSHADRTRNRFAPARSWVWLPHGDAHTTAEVTTMTPEEQLQGETLDERLAEESPERRGAADTSTPAGQLLD